MRVRERLSRLRPSWRRRHALVAIPLLIIFVVSEAEMVAPREMHLRPLLIVVPAITALFGGPLMTGVIAGITVGTHLLLGAVQRDVSLFNHEVEIVTLVAVSGLVIGYCMIREHHRSRLARVRSVSEAAQRVVLRPLPPDAGPLRIASMYLAAAAEARIGGDLYAMARTTLGTRLLIGDVRGKGLTSISDAALLLCSFRESSPRHITLHRLVAHLENSVYRNLVEFAETDEEAEECFVTAAVAEVPDAEPVIRLVRCGHPPPLLLRDGEVLTLRSTTTAPPLGLGHLVSADYEPDTFPFEPGDIVVLYTDGIVEARDPAGRFYPFAERVRSWAGGGPDTLVRHLRDDLLAYVHGRLDDDAAVVAVQRTSLTPDRRTVTFDAAFLSRPSR